MSNELKEVLSARNAVLFCEEELSPVFCKPKLIPLKSVTLEKLERMQNEAMEIMKRMEENSNETITKEKTEYISSKSEGKSTADIWTAEGNQEITTD
ncbi:Uncharacterized protein BM_BM4875 [Brugia malayi]|uniref:Bm4875 n=2 Tax=Brugia TaxID=6278 RepID=A0A4E9FMZ5_BRUMA|nr:Uncharacterized protein BM_BM4875 [Brugia malayi]VDO37162.1 unnamed protein product [Brugia timori]VIO96928.1 Uncharacterized protein BM_BM4875 [Brugia malayi]